MYVILPFEKDFYKNKHKYEVDFVGHPLLDAVHNQKEFNKKEFLAENKLSSKPVIALLPGSRHQEISKLLPLMLDVVSNFKDYQIVIASFVNFYFLYCNCILELLMQAWLVPKKLIIIHFVS